MAKTWLKLIVFVAVLTSSALNFGTSFASGSAAPAGPSVDVQMQGSATVGDDVAIRIHVNSDNPGATRVVPSCDGTNKFETSERDYTATWHTGGCSSGNATVTILSRDKEDPNWENPWQTTLRINLASAPQKSVPAPEANFWADTTTLTKGDCTFIHWTTSNANSVNIDGDNVDLNGDKKVCPQVSKHYSLRASGPGGDKTPVIEIVVRQTGSSGGNSGGGSQPPANFPFSNGDAIQIKEKIFIVCNNDQRCWVPNPETLYALGLNFTSVNNRGWSESQLKGIRQGQDVPDVNVDPNGFRDFKNRYFAGLPPYDENGNNGGSNGGGGGQPGNPADKGQCAEKPSRIRIGDIVIVEDATPDPLILSDLPDISGNFVVSVPVREQMSVVSGPACSNHDTWWQFGWRGKVGWAIEADHRGFYNVKPNDGSGNQPSTSGGNNNGNSSGSNPPKPTAVPPKSNNVNPTVAPNQTKDPGIPSETPVPEPGGLLGWLNGLVASPVEAYQAFNPGECTALVDQERDDVDKWARGNAEAFDNKACKAPSDLDIRVSKGDIGVVEIGDIIVWNSYCGDAKADGHTGTVKDKNESTNKVLVYHQNMPLNSGPHETWFEVEPCMSFIHLPNSGSDNSFCTNSSPSVANSPTVSPKPWYCSFLGWLGLSKCK